MGELIKVLAKQEHDGQLDRDENADRWYANTEPYFAKESRILITHWVGDAQNKLLSDQQYKPFLWRMFQKTGCLITGNGIDDDKIQPEGSPNYKVYPPMPLDSAAAAPVSNKVHPVKNDCQSIQPKDDEVQPGEQVEIEDNVNDRTLDAPLVGKKVNSLYENGWFEGKILYFNTQIREHNILFTDGTPDYVAADEGFDGIDLILLSSFF